ncbi:hypothetical protein BYT27DRAFT_6830796 [Phlegmacium glaucopus]|nr:hypothetical protein BYT27DRAFT_6830796 [Phlegmacium glaucopus]
MPRRPPDLSAVSGSWGDPHDGVLLVLPASVGLTPFGGFLTGVSPRQPLYCAGHPSQRKLGRCPWSDRSRSFLTIYMLSCIGLRPLSCGDLRGAGFNRGPRLSGHVGGLGDGGGGGGGGLDGGDSVGSPFVGGLVRGQCAEMGQHMVGEGKDGGMETRSQRDSSLNMMNPSDF